MKYHECNGCGAREYRLIRAYPGFENTDLVLCTRCQLMQAQPVPTEKFLSEYYQSTFGNSAETGFEMSGASEKGFRLRATLQYDCIEKICRLNGGAGKKILDVGCHAGSFLSLFKERGWEVTGVDPNPRSAYGEKWYGIRVIQKLFSRNMFPEASFDALLHSHALEHVPDPMGYLKEFCRILKPGGWAFIEVPNESLEKVATAKRIEPHLYFFTPDVLRRMASSAGFEVMATRVLGLLPYRTAPALRQRLDWIRLRWKARYDARGRVNLLTALPFFGKVFKEDRYFKDHDPKAEMLRVILRKPA